MGFFDGSVRSITRHVSAGGFSVLMARALSVGDEVRIVLRIPGGEPLSTSARAIEVKQQPGNVHVSFEFSKLEAADVERLEVFVFDALLEQLKVK